ncbi:serine hydrolase domain-containing protein [Clostridium gasigenes]|uniref:CubicO group peptidase, beta-lactamase class C family n=1 Tax=Clostridium gasigenes TaxID=94869 RepID=A0A1H0RKA9_9CLOT|nr:serine hydrolase domain-containing protein [Clostridium gasigenes]SDP29967.1 CubicO group peptidase, beta-lactamase class C family [Clostridium gasigenes]
MNINLNEYFKKQKKFSGNVLLSKNNEIIFNESYGYSNKEKGIKNTPQTKFMIGSMTKAITALCIMQLSEKGMLSTQNNIEDYIPDFYKGHGITIHHLLNHTSGIPNYIMLKKEIKWGEHHTPQEILQIVKGYKLKFPIGEKWSYSNTNYLILGLIIEIVSGMNYHQYVKDYIFIPAKMNNSGFIDEEQKKVANNYIKGEKGFYMDPSMFFACGDIVSTVGDFYLLDRAIQDGKLLKTQIVKEMQKPHHNGKYVKYGYGLFVKNHFDCKSICHGGSIPNGYTSHFEKYIDDDITIVVLSNDLVKYTCLSMKDTGGTYISREIASLVYGKKLGAFKKII